MLRLHKVVAPDSADVYVKLEYFNPTGSYKDRMALAMIEGAERSGRLRAGMRVIEYTGGSTGSSLAMVCAIKGYDFHPLSSDAFSQEKLDTMRAFGADLEIVPSEGGKVTPSLFDKFKARIAELYAGCGTLTFPLAGTTWADHQWLAHLALAAIETLVLRARRLPPDATAEQQERHTTRLRHVMLAVAGLLDDLTQRGMLQDVLVLVMGEFGRTPRLNKFQGRDHWTNAYSMVFAGAGVRGGQVIGRTDRDGGYVLERPFTPDDYAATVYEKLGIDHTRPLYTRENRPVFFSHGKPIVEITLTGLPLALR
mgnify:CR=1 FL=1